MAVTALDANLLLSSALLLVAVALPRLQPRWPAWLRIALRLAGFAAATVLVQRILGSPLAPRFDAPDPDHRLWEQVVEAGWWVLAGQVASGAARVFIVLKHRPRETRILSDLLSGAITVATGLAVIAFAFSVPIGGLLATSGVVAIVLGLALQSTLSDVFSGIAVGLEKPYAVGDLLWVEGGIEGTVRQVNWRSTQIATFDGNVAIVPNSIIAKARLINRSEPTPRRSDSVDIKVDPNAPPPSCTAALEAAVRNCGSILDQPAPTVLCRSLEGDGLSYRITFSVAASSGLPGARSELYDRVHHHLRCAGIGLAVPGKGKPRRLDRPSLVQLLERSELFGALAEGHRSALADQFTPIAADTGTLLLEKDAVPDALLMIASGTVGVSLPGLDGPRLVSRLGPGETLGAASLVTGSPFTATATALTPLQSHRIDRAGLGAALAADPGLAEALEALADRVFQSMRRDPASSETDELTRPGVFLDRLRNVLRLLNADG